ncbi:uncharacterized protein LOC129700673 [Leucoraja erinacea]|uniref:uncharacterized protein LOC129700673 n=1 Tax=Leucoraja erinaceus TaxID=7782 RepID=UPI002457B6CB|nr:uncharacterized protein LOC129700673 [Leucoraja erinacea]
MSMQHTKTKRAVKPKQSAEEVGPTEASGSVLTSSQEDVSKKTKSKKTEIEELRSFLSQEIASKKEQLKSFKEKLNFKEELKSLKEEIKEEIIASVHEVLEAWKATMEENLTQQIEEVNVKMNSMESSFNSRLDPIIQTLNQQNTAITQLEDIAETSAQTTKKLLSENKRLSDLLSKITEKCIDLEGRQRGQNLRIVGVQESREGNRDLREFAADLLKKVLNLDQKPLLGRAHRALGRRTRADAPARQLIVKVQYDHVLDDMMKKMVRSRDLLFEGDKISIFRDYPVEVTRKRVLFTETRRKLKNIQDLRYGLMYPATLRVTYKWKEYFFTDHKEALDFAQDIENKTDD